MSEKNYRVRPTDMTYEVSNKTQGVISSNFFITKQNDLMLHLASLQKMCSLFFSFDHPNYERYSTLYLVIMLENSHPGAEELLKRNGFRSTDRMYHHPGTMLTSPSSKQTTAMPNLTAALLVLAGIIRRPTDAVVHGTQERAICKRPKRLQVWTARRLHRARR